MDKPIQGFAGCTVNECGEVKINGKLQKPSANGRGYLKVFLPAEGGDVPLDPSTGSWRALSSIIPRGSRSSII